MLRIIPDVIQKCKERSINQTVVLALVYGDKTDDKDLKYSFDIAIIDNNFSIIICWYLNLLESGHGTLAKDFIYSSQNYF